jgi:NAD(P)-dependent dehydrogenase (short-subunit alcohol dehydrogenase family)
MSDAPFAGQQVVVTGGGTGIGRAAALAFADLGAANVIITGRRENRLTEVVGLHPSITAVVADVTTQEGAQKVSDAVKLGGGRVDVLVHNAGIVFVSSNAGHIAVPGGGVYGASKAAVDSLVRSWALELAPQGIRVNAVAPAAVRTEVYAANGLSPEEVEGYFGFQASQTPLGRTGEVDDVVPWITRFAEPSSSWVTGQIITLDGGADLA